MDELGFHRAMYRPGTLVDVGAHDGMLTLPFAALPGSHVVAFEPLPPAFARLESAVKAAYGGTVPPHVSLRPEALGDAPGAVTLALPWLGEDAIEQWASTVKDFEALQRGDPRITHIARYEAEVITLDSLTLDGVTAMKVDAEGAEEEVLRGAARTLARCLPVLSVELEERHRAGCTRTVPQFLAGFGYESYFEFGGVWHELAAFDAASMQVAPPTPADPPREPYVSVFVFVPPYLAARMKAML